MPNILLLIFPAVFLIVGLGIGGGLLYVNRRTRSHLQLIESARFCKAGSAGTGLIKLRGVVKAAEPQQLLSSPLERKPCVYYRFVIERFQSTKPGKDIPGV